MKNVLKGQHFKKTQKGASIVSKDQNIFTKEKIKTKDRSRTEIEPKTH